ncbi:MAG: hypothetical protein C4516_01880 [Oxalobacter sp.]|nr:MAG: hypothetical protein C4516_01880 [Oxalobacter sp.]
MKRSLLLVVLVSSLGLAACNKPAATAAPAYSGPQKVAYDAAVEKCKTKAFDARDKCVQAAMAPPAAAPAPAKK